MKYRTVISILVASILALTSLSSFAGQGQRGGGGAADRTHQADRDRTYDRDRMVDRDRTMDRARTEIPAHQRDQDQDRTHLRDPANMNDQDIYGNALMSDAERKQYRKELGQSNENGSGMEFQAQHEKRMQERALNQGQDLVPPGQGPVYGGEFMTVQERNEYRDQLRLCDSDADRQQLQAQHRDRIKLRANALGLEVEEAE